MSFMCVICLDMITKNPSGQTDVIATKCGHVYHGQCLLKWSESKLKVCPNCYKSIDEAECRKLFLNQDADTDKIDSLSEMKRKIKVLEADNLALKASAEGETMLLDILRFEYEELYKDSKFEISTLSNNLKEAQKKMSIIKEKKETSLNDKILKSTDVQEKEINASIGDKTLEDEVDRLEPDCWEVKDIVKELTVALNSTTPPIAPKGPNGIMKTSNSSTTDVSDSSNSQDNGVLLPDSANSSSSVLSLHCGGVISSNVLNSSTPSPSPNKISESDNNFNVLGNQDEESITSESLQLLIQPLNSNGGVQLTRNGE